MSRRTRTEPESPAARKSSGNWDLELVWRVSIRDSGGTWRVESRHEDRARAEARARALESEGRDARVEGEAG